MKTCRSCKHENSTYCYECVHCNDDYSEHEPSERRPKIDRVEKELSVLEYEIAKKQWCSNEWTRINNRIFFLKGWLACHRGEAI